MTDVFDRLMTKHCAIQKRDPNATPSSYNLPSTNYVDEETNVPCRISTLRNSGREIKVGKQTAIGTNMIYMRPRAFAVTEHHQILLETKKYNILNVNDPSGAGHHLELLVELVKP